MIISSSFSSLLFHSMFRYSASALSCGAPLFCGVPELSRRSTGAPWYSGYSTGVPRSVVPCSGVPAFIVCLFFELNSHLGPSN